MKRRLEINEANARALLRELDGKEDLNKQINRTTIVPTAPVIIGNAQDIGTARVRANHYDAIIDYCLEQENLKRINAPIR